MTPAERAAVHRLAGAFSRLSLAAQLVAQAKPGHARAALVDRMEEARRTAQRDFEAAQDTLSQPDIRRLSAGSADSKSALSGLDTRTACQPQPADIFDAIASGELPIAAPRKPSSATPKALPHPPAAAPSTPPRAAEAPLTSTTPRMPADAGGRRAVSRGTRAQPSEHSIAGIALRLAREGGRFTSSALMVAAGKSSTVVRAALGKMVMRGQLVYHAPPGGHRDTARGVLGTYALPGTPAPAAPKRPAGERDSKPRNMLEPRLARAGEPAADETAELARYGVRRLTPAQAAPRVSARAVPGVHRSVADFFADKPELPKHRPPVLPEYGGGRGHV